MNNDPYKQLHESIRAMRQEAKEMRDEVDKLSRIVGWSDWEPHTVGVIPIRVNGRWYWRGDRVFRKEKMSGLSGSRKYKYGDEFDVLRDNLGS